MKFSPRVTTLYQEETALSYGLINQSEFSIILRAAQDDTLDK